MKKGVLKIVFAVLIFLPVCANATIVKDFNENGTIQFGDYYDLVNIWDSAIVTMTGGEVLYLYSYGSSTFNLQDGFINKALDARNSSVMNLFGGSEPFTLTAYDSSVVNIYGYGFVVDYIGIKGFWANGDPLSIILRPYSGTYPHVILHEIPEPNSIVILLSGVLFAVRKYHKT